MQLTLQLPDEMAEFLPHGEAELAAVFSAGLRQWNNARNFEVEQITDMTTLLAGLPSPEEVLAIRPSAKLGERAQILLHKSKTGELTAEEQTEWDSIARLEHLIRVAKAKAATKIQAAPKVA
jgi:hypothetical protein